MQLDNNDSNIIETITEILSEGGDMDITIIIAKGRDTPKETQDDLTDDTNWDAVMDELFQLDVKGRSLGSSGGGSVQQPALLLE